MSARHSWRLRLAERELDGTTLLVLPGIAFIALLFVYPFLYGLWLSLRPMAGGGTFANYIAFFTTPYLYHTVGLNLWIAIPATIICMAASIPIALRVRWLRYQRVLTTLLMIPITLGIVLVTEGMLNYLGPRGWANRILIALGLVHQPIRLVHNYWGVLISIVITGFPLAFLLTLSFFGGLDPVIENAAAMLGARPWRRFTRIVIPLMARGLVMATALTFVYTFSVFPSAILVGAPDGPTRVISIAAYQAAFEQFDYSMASAVAMIMAAVQVLVVTCLMGLGRLAHRGPSSAGKG